MPRILFVSGFSFNTRARDLAAEFERYGRLVRCDVPAPRNHATASPYAFIEFRSDRDAEDAYYEMHGKNFDGHRLSVQWAKNPPSAVWRFEKRRPSPPRDRRRSRSRSPRRERDVDDRRRRSRSRDPRPVERDERRRSRSREREPRDRDVRDRDERDRDERKKRSPSPHRARTPPREDDRKEDDRAVTPPYDN